MSLGIHRLWKDSFVSSMLPRLPPSIHQNTDSPNPTIKCLDVAGGTGDIAFRLLDRAREKFGNRDVEVEIVDLNEVMLMEGRKRAAKTMYYNSESRYFHLYGIRRCPKLNSYRILSSSNHFHPWQCSIPSTSHHRQLHRYLHHRLWCPELYIPGRCA